MNMNIQKSGGSKFSSRRIISILGSKGGVGASMSATNIGTFLAQIGKRVVLVDMNLDSGGLNAFLGNKAPKKDISDVLFDRVDAIEDAIIETQVTSLYLLAGARNIGGSSSYSNDQLKKLWSKIKSLEADVIILDLPSNFNDFTLKLFVEADYSIIVTMPLPDCVESTYRYLTAAWIHSLCELIDDDAHDLKSIISKIKSEPGKTKTPREITSYISRTDKNLEKLTKELSMVFHPQIIVNQVKLKEDEELGGAMVSASARWLGVNPVFLGSIGWDDNVWLSLRRSKFLLVDFARSRACKDLEQIVRKILNLERNDLLNPTPIPSPVNKQTLYELLEIYPGASEEEIRRAFRQIKNWFGLEGMAMTGVCTDDEREHFQYLAETAHGQLVDRSLRREYDRTNFPDGFANMEETDLKQHRNIAGTVAATQESLPKVVLTDADIVDGTFLGNIRKKRNVDLIDISNRAKISVRYLQAIEEERFEDLPAKVFTRGFVTEFARFLKINEKRAADDFMNKFEEFQTRKKPKNPKL